VTDPISDSDQQGPRFRRAYETVLDEIRAVPEEDFVRISLNVTEASPLLPWTWSAPGVATGRLFSWRLLWHHES
jgi:hypothetical protein